MGFYKLYRIIKDFLKKPFRTAFIFIIIVFIISFCSSSFAVETIIDDFYSKDGTYSTDTYNLIVSEYDKKLNNFYFNLLQLNQFRPVKNISDFDYFLKYDYVVYEYGNGYDDNQFTSQDINNGAIYKVLFYDTTTGESIKTHDSYGNSYVSVPSVELLANKYYGFGVFRKDNKFDYAFYNVNSNPIYVPFPNFKKRSPDVDKFIAFNRYPSLYPDYNSDITSALNDIKDFLSDDTKDDSVVSTLPGNTDSGSDPTQSGFDNIFNSFKNAFTDNYVSEYSIPIPFANKSFYLTSDFLSNYAKKWTLFPGMTFYNFMSLFWYFIFSLYIVKDVEKVVEKIKNGDIATSSDTNIKTDML